MKQLKYVGFVRNELSGYVNWIGHVICSLIVSDSLGVWVLGIVALLIAYN